MWSQGSQCAAPERLSLCSDEAFHGSQAARSWVVSKAPPGPGLRLAHGNTQTLGFSSHHRGPPTEAEACSLPQH